MTIREAGVDPSGCSTPVRRGRARISAVAVLRWGTTWVSFLMVLPGLLSSRPVENGVTGAAVGLSATVLAAVGVYLWRAQRGSAGPQGAGSTAGRTAVGGPWWPKGTLSR